MPEKHGSRSRTGCSTCRTRKVKCDEIRPVCSRCQGARLPCEWLGVPRRQQRGVQFKGHGAAVPSLRRILLPRHHDGATTIPPSVSSAYVALPSSQELSRKDREYLAYFPHSLLVQILGKAWHWCPMHYLQSHVAPFSPAAMSMVLAVACGELEAMRCAQTSQSKPLRPLQRPSYCSVAYYHRALESFGSMLHGLDYKSPTRVDEVLSVFFLMIIYEQQFGQNVDELEAHLRGLYAYLAALLTSNKGLSWAALPCLSKQLLLFLMYINLCFSFSGRRAPLPRLWHEAGLEESFVSVMEQLFQGTRGVLGTMWASEYPTEELIDDISVSRPLQFYHECNMLKGKLLLEIYSGSRAPQPGDPWQQELQYIGRRFQDLLAIGNRSDISMRKHELQAIQFAVAEYHGLAVYIHELTCLRDHRYQGACCDNSLEDTVLAVHNVMRYDRDMVVRIQWPLLVMGKCKQLKMKELHFRESITEVLGSRGRFQHLVSLYDTQPA